MGEIFLEPSLNSTPLTCAQQDFPLGEVFYCECHPAQAFLRQVRRVCNHDIEALREDIFRQTQRVVVVIEDELITVCSESTVKLEQHGRHAARPIHVLGFQLLQLLVDTGSTDACYSEGHNKHN